MSLATTITLDDFASMLQYSSGWTAPDTSARGFPGASSFLQTLVDGTYHLSTVAGASVSLNWTGPSIALYGVAGPSAGFFDVSLDHGATTAPISAYSPTNTSHYLLWSSQSLSNGPHSITLTNLGANGNSTVGSDLMLDFASISSIVGAAGATLTNTTVDDLDRTKLTYGGTWSSNNDTRFFGNTSTYTNQDGGSVSMNFSGSAVYIYGDTVDDHGLFQVKLDNSTFEYDGKTAALKIGTLKFFAGDLDSSLHTLTITNLGTTFFDLDHITFTTPSTIVQSGGNSSTLSSGSTGSTTVAVGSQASQPAATPAAASAGPSVAATRPSEATPLKTWKRRLPPSLLSSTLRRPAALVARASFSSTRHSFALSSDPAKAPSSADQFANGNNAYYAEQMYSLWREDPTSVHPSWGTYFAGMDKGLRSEDAFRPPPGLVSLSNDIEGSAPFLDLTAGTSPTNVEDHMKVQLLVRAFQVRGHQIAKLDPLGINEADLDSAVPPELGIEHYGWAEKDLDKEYELGAGILPRFKEQGIQKLTLRKIIEACKKIYCQSVGIQYIHIPNREECDWIRERIEIPTPWSYSVDEKRVILDRLIWSDSFERFIASKYPNEKRFGLEGAESLIPGMKALIDRSVDLGVKSIVIGMPHRGRLNVLANVIRKPTEAILAEFAPSQDPNEEAAADVKYHLGANYVRPTPSGKRVSLSLVANPSHLEAEDGVVLGKTKGIQHFDGSEDRTSAMGLLLHGDAAFAGQGIVYETMGFWDLPNYGTGGTIHLIVNNQIGFTTTPAQGRSTPYPSDIAKSIDAPIFHVNGDDAEAVTFVCQLAADWRAKFHKDVVVDIVCYRRHGHNEGDQPMFTQPKMYDIIKSKPTTLEEYTKTLVAEQTFTDKETEKHKSWVWNTLEKAFEASKDYQPTSKEWLSSSWDGFPSPRELKENVLEARSTGVEFDTLKKVGKAIGSYPEGFQAHKNLARILKTRGSSVEEGKGIDYSTAEALAFGTLALEGNHVRVSGQDVERGTFSQRHAVLHDQATDETYTPLKNLSPDQAAVTICNSSLSEYGVLGFELGYSLVDPALLVIWEAQFGDFANGCQIMIDQFIASGEKKWLQRSGLVMSLPHGYDGQGPEHSSARIERFLQLCDDHPFHYPTPEKQARQHQDCNMQLVYPTIPSNIFHALRRQIHRDYRKPLIVFFSKNLLRHPQARSTLEEMGPDTHFQRYIPEPEPEGFAAPEDVQRHIICSGQVYYTLLAEREKRGLNNVAISRIEQLSPLPYDLLTPHLDRYPNAVQYWTQEEPINNGAWQYMQPRLETAMRETEHHKSKRIYVAGREPTSSVATGSKKQHAKEIQSFLDQSFDLEKHAQSHGGQQAH